MTMDDSSVDPMVNGDHKDEKMNVDISQEQAKGLAEDEKDTGNSFYKEKNYASAIEHYTKAIEYSPSTASYYSNRSAAHMMLKLYSDALKDAQTAVKLDNTFAKAYLREAKCHIALGNAQAALISLQRAKDLDASSDHAIMAEVRNARMMNQYEEQANSAATKKDYRQVEYYMRCASEISPACTRYKIIQGENLALMGKYDQALNIAVNILRNDKLNADAVYIRGICFYYDDNIDKALLYFTQALKLSPDHENARLNLKKAKLLARKKDEGNQAFKRGQTNKAYDIYTEALAVDPKNRKTNAKLFCNRALVCGKLKKYQQALDDCNLALELDPHYLKALQRRAKCYMDLERYQEAVQEYQKIFQQHKTRENQQLLKEAELELKKSKRKDYYKILGVCKDATDDQIKKAYRKQALVHHPDRHANASEEGKKATEQKFKEVGEAYAVLSDAKKRGRYDRGEDLDGPSMQDFDPNNIFQMFFGGAGGGGGGGPGMSFSHGGHDFGQGSSFSFQFG